MLNNGWTNTIAGMPKEGAVATRTRTTTFRDIELFTEITEDRNPLSTISQVLAKWPGPITLIAIAQLFGTSLWFSINGVMDDLQTAWTLNATELGWLTSAVQLGFISGTLFLSLTNLADRFNASHTFLLSCISGAFSNSIFTWLSAPYPVVWIFRFCVGLSLAGIYPIGMKLIVSWSKDS